MPTSSGAERLRTRLSVCAKKRRFAEVAQAELAIAHAGLPLRHYRCDRCRQLHLTSRTKGKRTKRPE